MESVTVYGLVCDHCTASVGAIFLSEEEAKAHALKVGKCRSCGESWGALANGQVWDAKIVSVTYENPMDILQTIVDQAAKGLRADPPQAVYGYADLGRGVPGERYPARDFDVIVDRRIRLNFSRAGAGPKGGGPAVGLQVVDRGTGSAEAFYWFTDQYALVQLAVEALKGFRYLREFPEAAPR